MRRAIAYVLPAAVLTVALVNWPLEFSSEALKGATSRIAGFRHPLVSDPRDLVINVLIFMPLGWSVAHATRSLGWAVGVAAALSAGIELSQLAQPARIVSPADLLANTLGALLAAVATLGLPTLVRSVGNKAPNPLMVACGGAVLAALAYCALEWTYGRLDTWDPTYPLVVNNEATGDRPWCGEVLTLELAAGGRTWTQDELNPAPAGKLEGCDAGQWLKTQTPPTALTAAVRSHNTLHVDLRFRSLRPDQIGPARIVSLSRDPSNRNVTIGQEGADVIVRLRRQGGGSNGIRPTYRVEGVLADSSPKHLVLDAGPQQTNLTVNDVSVEHRLWLARDWWYLLMPRWEWHSSPVHPWLSLPFWSVLLALPGLLVGTASRTHKLSVPRTGFVASLGGASACLVLSALVSPVPIETFLYVPAASVFWAVVGGHREIDRGAPT